jgi:hypothetical protein
MNQQRKSVILHQESDRSSLNLRSVNRANYCSGSFFPSLSSRAETRAKKMKCVTHLPDEYNDINPGRSLRHTFRAS